MTINEHQRRGSLARGGAAEEIPTNTNATNTVTNTPNTNNTAAIKSQPSTPTSPVVDQSHIAQRPGDFSAHAQHRQVVYFANGRPVAQGAPPAPAMYEQTGGYPMHMYQGVAYATYPVNGAPPDAAGVAAANAATTPTVQPQRSPAPSILAQHYNAVQNPRPAAPQTHTQHQLRGKQNHNNPRARFLPGIIPNPRASNNALYLPVANGNQAAMLIAGQYAAAAAQMNPGNMYHVHDGYRHSDNKTGAGCLADPAVAAPEYGKMGANMNGSRNMIQVNQHRGPIIQIQPTYQTYQAYITHPQRFVANPGYNKPHVWNNNNNSNNNNNNSSHRKHHRNTRNQSSNQQIRISRPNSNTNDADQKTVSHILEIYDFPTTVTSDADAIFDEIKSCGARILKINSSSSSQSLNNSHGNSSNQKPTILAIFKSAGEAQRALESVTSPYYKLRVSQKSPTHFAGGECGPQSSTLANKNSN